MPGQDTPVEIERPDTPPALPGQDGRWLTLEVAADVLGVHERTLRRRIAGQQYQVERSGQRVWVWLPTNVQGPLSGLSGQRPDRPANSEEMPGQLPGQDPDIATQALAVLERLFVEERERAASVTERAILLEQRASAAEQAAAMWQERARNLEAQVAALAASGLRRAWSGLGAVIGA